MSGNVISLVNTIVTINGHIVEGWADDSSALEFEDIDLHQGLHGPDGLALYNRTGRRGGMVTLKLLGNSVSTRYFMIDAERIKAGYKLEYSGNIFDCATLQEYGLLRGVMMRAPFGQSRGSDVAPMMEFQFDFTQIVAIYDNVIATPVPSRVRLT